MADQKTPQRSEGLLPAEDEVAEEVNLDQQSDQARRVGHAPMAPAGKPGDGADKESKPQ